MKKLYTFLILVGCCVQAYPQHQAASFTFNQPLSGGGHHYQARDFIDMEPGFEYEAITPGEEFVAEIVTSLIPEIEFLEQPISSNRPLDYNLEVGTIEGNFYVDLKGKATYKIPVELPPGTNGLKPDLEIEYKSTLTNSYLGVGWRLNGLYSITRSGSTFFYDGFVNGITMTEEDRFILDGERLIVVNGLYGKPNSEYRTANESFNRITLLGDQNDGTEWFIVESKEGIKRYYGNSPNSRQWLPNSNSILTWFLNRIEDNQGNYIDYYYRHDQNYTYIDKIEYTGNSKNKTLPQNTIQFFYSRYKHEDYFYLINDKIKCELLISSIHIQTNTNRSLIYSFDYYFNHFPLLNQIKLANNEEESFNSTVFSYHEPKAYYQDQPTLSIPGCFHKLGSHFDHGGGTMLATEDFSNSGRSDFISFNDNTPDFYNR
ncbi:MAG TPA: SpvB/TcaC N-terminal domain-containing protein, partial [Bacteroidales bacterium]|nr:SpvB/TcaC N-terminal domain-containing protein [Bacteroidales bacterium]